MPAYARDGKVVCFFQSADKFKARYATLGFNDSANLDEGAMWPTSFALKELTAAEEARIAALVKKSVRLEPRGGAGRRSHEALAGRGVLDCDATPPEASPWRGRFRSTHDHRDGDHDRGAGGKHLRREVLAQEGRADQHGDDRVHVRVGGDQRDRRRLEQPHVRDEPDERPDHDQVGEAEERLAETAAESSVSPRPKPTTHRSTPPASDARPAEERRARQRRVARVERPAAHAPADSSATTAPTVSIGPPPRGSTRRARPAKPSAMPATARTESRCPNAIRSRTATQSGIEPTTSAATPDGIRCAQQAPPWPPRKSAPPKMNAATTWGRPIPAPPQKPPREEDRARDQMPAAHGQERRDRADGERLIAAKVDPQTM